MTLFDANYFLRWLLNDTPAQNRAVKKFLRQAPEESISLDQITLAEITYVLRSLGYNHEQIATAIREFCYQDAVRPLDETASLACSFFAASNLDFEDCWLAARAATSDVEIATFDKKLQKLVAQAT